MNKEFTKFSLHNHFGFKNGGRCRNDPSGTTYYFDLENAKKRIDDAKSNGYRLLGFTNHNIFRKNNFVDLSTYACSLGIKLLPGVELDVVDNETLPTNQQKFLHVVVLFDENFDLDILEKTIDKIVTDNGNNFATIEQLCDLAIAGKCIVCPHGYKQRERGAVNNIDQFLEIMGMITIIPIFLEDNRLFHKELVKGQLSSYLKDFEFTYFDDYMASISCADESDFGDVVEPTYVWGDATFDSLFYAGIIGDSRILKDNDLSEKTALISKVIIQNDGGVLQSCELDFSEGLNAFIGTSGSGKTLFLNLIKKKLTGSDLECSVSTNCAADYNDLYKGAKIEFIDKNGNPIKENEFKVFEGESLYKKIIDTYSKGKSEMLKLFNIEINYDKLDSKLDIFNEKLNDFLAKARNINNQKTKLDENFLNLISLNEYILNNDTGLNADKIFYSKDNELANKIAQINKENELLVKDKNKFDESRETIAGIIEKYKLPISYDKQDNLVKLYLNHIHYGNLKNAFNHYSTVLIQEKISDIIKLVLYVYLLKEFTCASFD